MRDNLEFTLILLGSFLAGFAAVGGVLGIDALQRIAAELNGELLLLS
jgi:hypothetical protein